MGTLAQGSFNNPNLDPSINVNANTGADIDGRAPVAPTAPKADLHHNPAVFGTQGTTILAADHQTQTFAALVVHLNSPGATEAVDAIKTSITWMHWLPHHTLHKQRYGGHRRGWLLGAKAMGGWQRRRSQARKVLSIGYSKHACHHATAIDALAIQRQSYGLPRSDIRSATLQPSSANNIALLF